LLSAFLVLSLLTVPFVNLTLLTSAEINFAWNQGTLLKQKMLTIIQSISQNDINQVLRIRNVKVGVGEEPLRKKTTRTARRWQKKYHNMRKKHQVNCKHSLHCRTPSSPFGNGPSLILKCYLIIFVSGSVTLCLVSV
jgi:hypothetical protein